MPLPIVSISRRVQGLEALAHFAIIEGSLSGGSVCVGCGTHLWDRVSPVELADGGALDADSTWDCSPLCRVCSYRSASRIVGGPGWSGLGSGDVAAVWDAVRDEQARELDNELSRERAAGLAAERKAFDEAQAMAAEATRIEREREESMLAAERDRLRAEQERLDAIRREQEEAARKLEKERAEAERAEAERQATIRAEEEARVRAERQRLEAEAAKRQEEIRAAEHAAQMEALKGDSTKLADLAESIEGIAIPTVKSELAQTVVEGARSALAEIAQGLREVAAE